MIKLQATRYDGNSSARLAVDLYFSDSGIQVQGADLIYDYPYADVNLQPRLAGMPAQLRFSDGSQCEVAKQHNLEVALACFPGQNTSGFIHKLENYLPYILITAVVSIAVVVAIIQYAVPVMARTVAYRIPVAVETTMGNESLQLLDQFMPASKLSDARQSQLREQFQQLIKASGVDVKTIVFRQGDAIGANAFALPSGIIVFTDEIIALSKDDRELLAVFAHELAHVKYRHTMRQVLQNSVTGLLVIMLTGDVGSASSLAAALPTLLVQTKFSRDFETEADDYAIHLLQQQAISPAYLGDMLQRLEAKLSDGSMPGFISTHPATAERILKFQQQSHD